MYVDIGAKALSNDNENWETQILRLLMEDAFSQAQSVGSGAACTLIVGCSVLHNYMYVHVLKPRAICIDSRLCCIHSDRCRQ